MSILLLLLGRRLLSSGGGVFFVRMWCPWNFVLSRHAVLFARRVLFWGCFEALSKKDLSFLCLISFLFRPGGGDEGTISFLLISQQPLSHGFRSSGKP